MTEWLEKLLAEVSGKGNPNDRNSQVYYTGYRDALKLVLAKMRETPKTAPSLRKP